MIQLWHVAWLTYYGNPGVSLVMHASSESCKKNFVLYFSKPLVHQESRPYIMVLIGSFSTAVRQYTYTQSTLHRGTCVTTSATRSKVRGHAEACRCPYLDLTRMRATKSTILVKSYLLFLPSDSLL
jgi:hypothetical protein